MHMLLQKMIEIRFKGKRFVIHERGKRLPIQQDHYLQMVIKKLKNLPI